MILNFALQTFIIIKPLATQFKHVHTVSYHSSGPQNDRIQTQSFSFNLKIQLIANNLYFEFKFKKRRTVYID